METTPEILPEEDLKSLREINSAYNESHIKLGRIVAKIDDLSSQKASVMLNCHGSEGALTNLEDDIASRYEYAISINLDTGEVSRKS